MYGRYGKLAIKAALKSGLYIKNSVGRTIDVSYKGLTNIVTNVDKTSERMIVDSILSVFPEHSILTEESIARDADTNYRWIIDPLDGTTNFSRSFPFFSVSIGLEIAGVPAVGVIFDPMRGELFYAERGGGAKLNNRKIRVSATKVLRKGFLATGFSYNVHRSKDNNVANFERFLKRSFAIRRAGSAALDLAYVACGRFDGYWECELFPWDSAAGILIVREAFGRVTRFSGTDATPYDKDILATNALIHGEMSRVLGDRNYRRV